MDPPQTQPISGRGGGMAGQPGKLVSFSFRPLSINLTSREWQTQHKSQKVTPQSSGYCVKSKMCTELAFCNVNVWLRVFPIHLHCQMTDPVYQRAARTFARNKELLKLLWELNQVMIIVEKIGHGVLPGVNCILQKHTWANLGTNVAHNASSIREFG